MKVSASSIWTKVHLVKSRLFWSGWGLLGRKIQNYLVLFMPPRRLKVDILKWPVRFLLLILQNCPFFRQIGHLII